MAGEINGTNVVIENSVGVIVGQGTGTLTWNATPIDISNKSNGDSVSLMDGEGAGKQLQYACEFVYNTGATFQTISNDAHNNTMDTYTITIPSGGTTDESYTALMMPTGLSVAVPYGDKMTSSVTFLSSGAVTHVPYVA
jgi:hypothetical protein